MQRSKGQGPRSGVARPAVLTLAVAVTLGLALLAAACGGGGSTGDSSEGDPEAYSACMRTHGVPNFPDPDSTGRIKITSGVRDGQKTGVDVNSPQFKKAERACQKLQPSGGTPNRQEQAKEQRAMLRFARCMRLHGVPNFPDPKFTPDGNTEMTIGKDVNPASPQFTAAKKACKGFLRNSPLAGETP
jgi:hypothetical protein